MITGKHITIRKKESSMSEYVFDITPLMCMSSQLYMSPGPKGQKIKYIETTCNLEQFTGFQKLPHHP